MRGLAVTTAQRQPEVPHLPSIAEFVPGYDVSSWFALFVAAKTPPTVIAKLHADAVAALNTPAVKARYAQLGATVVASTPAELAAHLKSRDGTLGSGNPGGGNQGADRDLKWNGYKISANLSW